MIILLFAIGITMGSLGSICLKVGGSQLPHFSPTWGYVAKFFGNPYVLGGFVLYFLPALIWIYLLGKYPISFVQPILALTYVLTPVLAIFLLNEKVPTVRWLGIAVIIIGVVIVSRSQA
jgi:drug/metabolite transporter (DMT)-like permease